MKDYNYLITELVNYGVDRGLTDELDRTYTINKLVEALGLDEYVKPDEQIVSRKLHLILEDFIALQGDLTGVQKDLFDTKLMGLLTPPPSYVVNKFNELREASTEDATDWYYTFSRDTNYIRTDRIAKDIKWNASTEYGDIDITINLSKPEKDPRDIAAAGKAKSTSYPKCLLCVENEGFAGTMTHPARQNHRIIPITLDGDAYYLQYSPYVYYNEHCIVFNKEHIPMVINRSTFVKLLSFVEQFPHYIVGSNADLPIVGGSILSHDHFQGGCYTFPMARASYEKTFTIPGFEDITAGIIKWPMSVIRLTGSDASRMADLADKILASWREYTDEDAFIFAETEGVPHNTITPIARMNKEGKFELDLVLRNNITTEEHPLGVYHPHQEYHHLKKENIGLIEVMGLAILPARLKKELNDLAEAVSAHKDISTDETLSKHDEWVNAKVMPRLGTEPSAEEALEIIKDEVGIAFSEILECAGVYKRDDAGKDAFMRFVSSL
ncbi:MAG: UDP-glucose--hexose-1-phosphate uridylyltransferase [Clostridiales bacterium]|nr:UDP-glucose--hexose-1-phosphate uridylyltransferase [Clostridiales bacterium]